MREEEAVDSKSDPVLFRAADFVITSLLSDAHLVDATEGVPKDPKVEVKALAGFEPTTDVLREPGVEASATP